MPRLDFISLKTRISSGFILVCGLLCIVGISSFYGFARSRNRFFDFSRLSAQAELHAEIDRDVAELQRQVKQFTFEGHKTAELKVYELFETLNVNLNAAQKSANDVETRRIIDKMVEHKNIYLETFNIVATERKLRSDLVQKELRTNVQESENVLAKYIKIENDKNHIVHVLEANLLLNGLLRIEKNSFRYFDLLDSTLITKAKENFTSLHSSITKLIKEEQGEKVYEKLKADAFLIEAQQMITEYEKVLLRAVQATRGYLYLVNVVMAGEASEFLYNAGKLKSLSTQNRGRIKTQLNLLINKVSFFTVLVTIIAIVIGIVLSWIIGRSITVPVTQITNSFKLLAEGNYSLQIPCRDFKDEIGDLSRAADVFKEKNLQTEQLLQEAQEMTGELDKKRDELARSNDEMEQFVYTVSHDLKSPLVTSMGFIDIINALAAKGEYEKAIGKLDRVVKANTRMGQLINDLLELSRVGRINMDKKQMDMNIVLKTFKESLGHELREEQFEMIFETKFPTICINESRILQLFENMMSNAFKYAKNPAGENIVKIGSREDNGEHLFYIRDNGPGISSEYHEKIFGLFYRLDNTMEGTGIGLAVARKVMQFHNGRIWIESEPGHGATFWLAFPGKLEDS